MNVCQELDLHFLSGPKKSSHREVVQHVSCVEVGTRPFFAAKPTAYGVHKMCRITKVLVIGEGCVSRINQRANYKRVSHLSNH